MECFCGKKTKKKNPQVLQQLGVGCLTAEGTEPCSGASALHLGGSEASEHVGNCVSWSCLQILILDATKVPKLVDADHCGPSALTTHSAEGQ